MKRLLLAILLCTAAARADRFLHAGWYAVHAPDG